MSQSMQVLTSSKSNEWYTPPWLIELARECMGSIDLDPASCATAQKWIQADIWYGEGVNGLIHPWNGNIWLNPPYGRTVNQSNAGIWATKLEQEYNMDRVQQAILLVNSAHGYEWYESLWRKYPVICLRDRVRFVNIEGKIGGQSKKAQTLVYFGRRIVRFERIFKHLGRFLHADEE